MRYFLLSLFAFTFFASSIQATHVSGGDLGWKCLADGKYQFYFNLYSDCKGIGVYTGDITIGVDGPSLPQNASGASVSSITLEFDSTRNGGIRNISPQCTDTSGQEPFDCSRGTNGTKHYYFISKPILLKGKVPRSGWVFSYSPSCCPSSSGNLIPPSGESNLFRSIMYVGGLGANRDSCYDSSPEFFSPPSTYFCRGALNNFHLAAVDIDGDEVKHSLSDMLYGQATGPSKATYNRGYSFRNPTPDASIDSNNVASVYNSRTGLYTFSVNNGVGVRSYAIGLKAESSKNGKDKARVEGQFFMSIYDCPVLADSSINNTPTIKLDTAFANYKRITVKAGDLVKLPIEITDNDTINGIPQEVKFTVKSTITALDFKTDTLCLDSNQKPCAYFQNKSLKIDTTVSPQVFSIVDSSKISTELNWQTECNHLNADKSAKSYFFFLTAQDNACPIPLENNAVVEVIVTPDSAACGLITAIDEVFASFKPIISPNPTNGKIRISFNDNKGQMNVQIRNIAGQLIQEKQFNNQSQIELNLEGKAGVYFIQLSDEKGQRANLKVLKN